MTIQIQTQRLLLRRWNSDDLAPYSNICADPEVMKWIGNGDVRSTAECADAISDFEIFWEKHGFGLFAVERLSDRQLIGFTGLAIPNFLPEVLPSVEIGWRFGRHAWRQGYATEAALASLDYGLKNKQMERIVSIHQIGNEASGRIMEKIGMNLEREAIDPSCGRQVRVYEIIKRS